MEQLKRTKARVAVTYLSWERPTEESAASAEENEAAIKRLLPGATPVAVSFGADLGIDGGAVSEWRSPA